MIRVTIWHWLWCILFPLSFFFSTTSKKEKNDEDSKGEKKFGLWSQTHDALVFCKEIKRSHQTPLVDSLFLFFLFRLEKSWFRDSCVSSLFTLLLFFLMVGEIYSTFYVHYSNNQLVKNDNRNVYSDANITCIWLPQRKQRQTKCIWF